MIWNVKQEIIPSLDNDLHKNNIVFLIKISINVIFFFENYVYV